MQLNLRFERQYYFFYVFWSFLAVAQSQPPTHPALRACALNASAHLRDRWLQCLWRWSGRCGWHGPWHLVCQQLIHGLCRDLWDIQRSCKKRVLLVLAQRSKQGGSPGQMESLVASGRDLRTQNLELLRSPTPWFRLCFHSAVMLLILSSHFPLTYCTCSLQRWHVGLAPCPALLIHHSGMLVELGAVHLVSSVLSSQQGSLMHLFGGWGHLSLGELFGAHVLVQVFLLSTHFLDLVLNVLIILSSFWSGCFVLLT